MKTRIAVLGASLLIVGQVRAEYSLPNLPPIPETPAPLPIDSVPLGVLSNAPEIKLDLPIAAGPYEPTWESIEKNYPGPPAWLREAKFGIWVHFGPQSAGQSGDWYARKLYVPGTSACRNHLKNFGHPSEVGYKEVLRDWNPIRLDPAALTKIYSDAGARFLIIQGVHHDNFDLWESRYQPWNSTRLGPKRDLIGEWSRAARAAGMHYGVTFHHEYTWWWWQTAFGSDTEGPKAGVPYDAHLTLADGKGKWWEGLDPRLLYTVDLREYVSVSKAAASPWSPPDAGLFTRHTNYAKWYATWWALRMMDVIDHYDPDFIYTDGTGAQPFEGSHTGTGMKADAMQRVIAHYYNRTLEKRGKVDTFSVVKFRPPNNGTVNTEEFGIPRDIKTNQAWIAEAPVGDWFYAPNFTYDSGMMIRYIVEAAARDGNAGVCVSLLPDGSLDEGSTRMLREVGAWMRRNGQGIYGSKAWSRPGEGELAGGRLKMLPGGKLGRRHADFTFSPRDFRFTVGKDGALLPHRSRARQRTRNYFARRDRQSPRQTRQIRQAAGPRRPRPQVATTARRPRHHHPRGDALRDRRHFQDRVMAFGGTSALASRLVSSLAPPNMPLPRAGVNRFMDWNRFVSGFRRDLSLIGVRGEQARASRRDGRLCRGQPQPFPPGKNALIGFGHNSPFSGWRTNSTALSRERLFSAQW